jgi:hypothetical protein
VNLNRGLFCGKDVIKLNESFYQLGYVKEILTPPSGGSPVRIPKLIVYGVYDLTSELILPTCGKV